MQSASVPYLPLHGAGSQAYPSQKLWAMERRYRRALVLTHCRTLTEQERAELTVPQTSGGVAVRKPSAATASTWLSEAELRDAEAAVWFTKKHGVVSLLEAMKWYVEHSPGARQAPPVGRCVLQFVAARQAEALRKNTLRTYRTGLRDLAAAFDTRPVVTVTADHIRELLRQYKSGTTRRDRWRVLSQFFRWCMDMGYAFENPVLAAMRKPRVEKSEKLVLKPKETRRILQHAMENGTAGYWALALFSGMRRAEIQELQRLPDPWSVVRWSAGVIDLPASIGKTGARFIPINPCLRQWLRWIQKRQLPFWPSRFWTKTVGIRRRVLAELTGEAIPENPNWRLLAAPITNVTRRSYISCRLALPNASYLEVSAEVGSYEVVLRKHYFCQVSRAEAQAYFALTPNKI